MHSSSPILWANGLAKHSASTNQQSSTLAAFHGAYPLPNVPSRLPAAPRSVLHVLDWAFVPFWPTLASIAAGSSPEFDTVVAAIKATEGVYVDVINGLIPVSGVALAPTNA